VVLVVQKLKIAMKNNKLLISISAIIAVSALLMAFLYSRSIDYGRIIKSGFNRKFTDNSLVETKSIDLKYNSYYIAGVTRSRVYLGNWETDQFIRVLDENLQPVREAEAVLITNDSVAWSAIETFIDSPYIAMYDNVRGQFYSGLLADFNLYPRCKRIFLSLGALPLSANSWVIRRFDKLKMQYDLYTVNCDSISSDHSSPILQSQQDGIFSVDGMLAYDKPTRRVIFLYYYRNTYIVMDSNLNVECVGSTIDTVQYAHVSIADINSSKKQTLTGTPLLINARFCLDRGKLYIQSARRADNESPKEGKLVIDCYDVANAKYLESFYVPAPVKKMTSFKVAGNKLYLVEDHTLREYELPG